MGREDLLRLLYSVNIYGVELRLGFSKGKLETTWELIEHGWGQGIWDKYLGNLMGKLIGVGLGNFSICIFLGRRRVLGEKNYEGMEVREGELITRRKGRKG